MTESSWNTIQIKDLGKVITGRTPPTVQPGNFGNDYAFLTPSDMGDRTRIRTTERYLSKQGADLLRKILIPSNSVCVSCIGWQMGKVVMVKVDAFTNQQINTIIPNDNVCPEYLLYALLIRREELKNLGSSGTRTPILNKSSFEKVLIKLPPLPIQRKIAAILSAYDDLIENNQRRIAILEELARSLYREWFVHFRFPGHEQATFHETELGRVPEGWEVKPIGEVIEVLGGGTPSTKEPLYWEGGDINWFSPTDLTGADAMFISKSAKKITQAGLAKSSARMFRAYSVMMTSRATIGVVSINTEDASTNQGFITCLPNEGISTYQLYFWLLEHKNKIETLASGATFKEISKSTFRQIPMTIPSNSLAQRFTATVDPIAKQIQNLLAKNTNLRQTRDLLLPRLVSGELDVVELEIAGVKPDDQEL